MHATFEQVIHENHQRIKCIASRYSHGNDIEDIYQEILMQLWRSFDSFQGTSSRATWLYKVALNTACTFVSKTIKHRELQHKIASFIQPDTSANTESCQADILDQFMSTLSDTDASLLMMYLDDMSSEQMAEVTGSSANAVRSRLKRIKQNFESQFEGEA